MIENKIGRPCKVCIHERHEEIDAALIAGMSPLAVSKTFDVSRQSVERHRAAHVPTPAQREGAIAVAEEEALTGGELLRRAAGLLSAAQQILGEARDSGDRLGALRAIREAGRMVELCAKLTGEIDENVTINVLVAPALQALQHVILAALAPFPAARQAVVLALSNIDGDGTRLIEGRAE